MERNIYSNIFGVSWPMWICRKLLTIRYISAWFHALRMYVLITVHKKWSFPLRISSVNVTKSARNWLFGHIYWKISSWKTSIFCAMSKGALYEIPTKSFKGLWERWYGIKLSIASFLKSASHKFWISSYLSRQT